MRLERVLSSDPEVRTLLAQHPRVDVVEPGSLPLEWTQGVWSRRIHVGKYDEQLLHGLVELMDNNPLVCADEMSVPSPAATLALIALGPIAAAGLLVESPTLVTNAPADEAEVAAFLATEGWPHGISVHSEPLEAGDAWVATAMAAITTPDDPEDIADLFEERFGRSFFVQAHTEPTWDSVLVEGRPNGLYRLGLAVDQPHSLLTVRVLADRRGKAGAAQIVHALNVMCGFEESLGLV